MQAVILAGGLGTRLRPFTEVIPKPLLPVGEKSVLEVQILHLKKYGFTDIYIATNYKSDYIESFMGDGSRYGVRLTFSKEKEPLGTCGPVTLLKDRLRKPFILMNGDILTTLNFRKLYDFALHNDAKLTVVTKKIVTPFQFGNVTADGDYIVDIEEKPNFRLEILAGIYVMKPEIFPLIPENQYFGMDTLIKNMLASREKVARYLMKEYWIDIGRFEDYEAAQKEFEKHFNGTI
jgi:NDP-sugar pyrophosphorylase family protein